MISKKIKYIYGDNNSEVLSLVSPNTFEKTAEMSEELEAFVNSIKPTKGFSFALVNALSAGEYYGSNRNGDYFPEKALKEYHKTFEVLGHVYKHHVNKDPKKSLGSVVFSHYNPTMHRVELILKLDNSKASDVIEKLDKGFLSAVSMGCGIRGSKVLIENFTKKAIEKIQVGDKVLTHAGEIKKVTELHLREYCGNVYTINPSGKYREKVTMTKEHPWLVVEPSKFYIKDVRGRLIRNKNLTAEACVWKTSEELEGDEYLVIPKPQSKEREYVSVEMAKLLGWYLAEGHVHLNGGRTEFTVNKEDSIVSEIDKIASMEGMSVIKRSHNVSDKALRLIIYSKEFKQTCLKYCKKYSRKKELHKEIFNWSRELKLNFLGAYLSGDGFFYEGIAYASSANKKLLEQIQWLGYSLGLLSTLGKNEHKAGKGFSKHATTEWILRFRGDSNSVLAPYCSKVIARDKELGAGKGGPYKYDSFNLIKIDAIEESHYEGIVYNFEVEDDNSYVVEQYAVHNCKVPWDECSICGNRAKHRYEYCSHLRKDMSKIYSGGRKVYAINRRPKFFDISIVLIPADRTASFLRIFNLEKTGAIGMDKFISKLAFNEENNYIKLAEMISTSEIRKVLPDSNNINGKSKSIILLPKIKGKIDSNVLKKLAEYPLNEVLSTFIALRIFPSKQDFQKLSLYSEGKTELANKLESENIVFKIDKNTPFIIPNDLSLNNASEKIARELEGELYKTALLKETIITRELLKIASDPFPAERSLIKKFLFSHEPEPETTSHKNPIVPLGILGGLYYGFAKIFGDASVSKFRTFIKKKPWLLPLIIGGVSLSSLNAQSAVFDKTAGIAFDRFFRNSLVTFPTSYYFSAKAENKVKNNKEITPTENFIRKHPALVALVASLGGVKTEKLLKKKFNKVANLVNRMSESEIDTLFTELVTNYQGGI